MEPTSNHGLSEDFWQTLDQRHCAAVKFPSTVAVTEWADEFLCFLFPQHSAHCVKGKPDLKIAYACLISELAGILSPLEGLSTSVAEITNAFTAAIPKLSAALHADAEAMLAGDPAAQNLAEIVRAYPGFRAVSMYRIAHLLHHLGAPLVPRLITEHAHAQTGIDIHPYAHIGANFCIDHGTGIVIGETTVIGDNVKVYQGVTLGGLSIDKEMAGSKRHPTIEDNVVIYANATILGGETVIGANSVIGGNVWLTSSVAPHSTVYFRGHADVETRTRKPDPTQLPSQKDTNDHAQLSTGLGW